MTEVEGVCRPMQGEKANNLGNLEDDYITKAVFEGFSKYRPKCVFLSPGFEGCFGASPILRVIVPW